MTNREWGKPFKIQVPCEACEGVGNFGYERYCAKCDGTGTTTVSIACEPTAGVLVAWTDGSWKLITNEDAFWIRAGVNQDAVEPSHRFPIPTPILPSPAACREAGVTWRDVIPCDDELEDTVTGETCRVWNTPAGSLNILGDGDVQLGWLDLGSDEDHENAELLLHCRKVLKQWKAQFDEGVQ